MKDQAAADRSIFKPALMLMGGRAVGFVVTFFIPIILVRTFSPAEFGTYKQIFLIAYTLWPLMQLGFAECLYYFIPSNPDGAARYVANSTMMLTAAGVACAAGLMLSGDWLAAWMGNPALASYIPLTALYIVLLMMSTALEIAMMARKRYRWATATYALSDVVRAAMLLLPAVLTGSLMWVMIGGVAFCLMRVFATAVYIRSEFSSELALDRKLLRAQCVYALPFSMAVFVELVQGNYHQFAVSSRFDVETFAIYSVGCLNIPIVDFMTTACNVMMVRMSEELREGRVAQTLEIWHDGTRKLALMFFPMVGLLIVNATPLITLLFTETYRAAIPIFMVWSLSIGLSAFQTAGILRVFNQTKFIFLTNLVRLITIALLMTWSLNTFHLMGAVYVTIIGIVVAKVMSLVRMQSLMETSFARILPWRQLGGILIVSMVSAIVPLILNAKLSLPPVYMLPIGGVVYLFGYSVMVLSFGLLTLAERQVLATYVWNSRNYFSRRPASGS